MRLFTTGFIQVFFVSINTWLISRSVYLGVFLCGFTISFIWSWNVKKIAFGKLNDRLLYSMGAAAGSLGGLVFSEQIINKLI